MISGILEPPHLLLLLALWLVAFGPGKLPGLGAALGQAVRQCKAGIAGDAAKEGSDARER